MAEPAKAEMKDPHVFISHKSKDENAATMLKALLTDSIKGLRVFASCDAKDIPTGNDWSDQIHEQLAAANWLILLYTDPTDTWDWCLYECGYHAYKIREHPHGNGRGDDKHYKMTVLCPEGVTPPAPLTQWQYAGAKLGYIETLLADLEQPFTCKREVEPISAEKRTKIAQDIRDLVQKLSVTYSYEGGVATFSTAINKENGLKDPSPDQIRIAADEKAADVLGLEVRKHKLNSSCKLSDVPQVNGSERIDHASLLRALRQAASESQRIDPALLPVVFSGKQGMGYLPIVQRTIVKRQDREFDDGPSVAVQVLLVESPLSYRPNSPEDAVHNLLFVARSFRWKVIEEYQGLMQNIARQREVSADDAGRLREMDEQIDLNMRQARGKQLSEDLLRRIDRQRAKTIQDASDGWAKHLSSFRHALKQGGEETARAIVEAYVGMRSINRVVLEQTVQQCSAQMEDCFVLDRDLMAFFTNEQKPDEKKKVEVVVPASSSAPAGASSAP